MIAFVTGAGRGIGRAIAERLAADFQAGLFLTWHRRERDAEAARAACLDAGSPDVVLCQLDVADSEACTAAVGACIDHFERLDTLVNNAGVTADGLVLQMTDEAWRGVLATNLDGVFHTARAAARQMLMQKHGRIINISSVSGRRPNRGQANYAASKAGLEAFTRALAVELGRKRITVNAVAPGVIETEMSQRVRDHAGVEIRKAIPMRRFGSVADVAGIVSFLAGPDAGYITGQVIGVDGGIGL